MNETDCRKALSEAIQSGGDLTAPFDAIINLYSERLYWHIRRIVVTHEEAEDALQDTLVQAFLAANSFRGEGEGSLTGWLYRIATNIAIKSLKRRRGWNIFIPIDLVSKSLVADFEGEIAPEADQIAIALQRAIVALPLKQRLVFNMRYYDELPFEQISQITGQSVSTLKTNYHYAVQKIKNEVTKIEL